jgi:hypothetical protein
MLNRIIIKFPKSFTYWIACAIFAENFIHKLWEEHSNLEKRVK